LGGRWAASSLVQAHASWTRRPPYLRLGWILGRTLIALDVGHAAHEHGWDQGKTDGYGGSQPVAAMV
jgi:hypothetical protein